MTAEGTKYASLVIAICKIYYMVLMFVCKEWHYAWVLNSIASAVCVSTLYRFSLPVLAFVCVCCWMHIGFLDGENFSDWCSALIVCEVYILDRWHFSDQFSLTSQSLCQIFFVRSFDPWAFPTSSPLMSETCMQKGSSSVIERCEGMSEPQNQS